MNKSIIKRIIIEKQEEILQTKLLDRAIPLEVQCNYVFVGMRRAGKSYLMFQHILTLIKQGLICIQEVLYINFEDERLAMMEAAELGEILDSYEELFNNKPFIYLDEIQNIKGWEKLAESVMQPCTQTRLQHIVSSAGVKITRNTVVEYIRHMGDAYLVFGLSNYSDNLRAPAKFV